ncbi:purine nucleoside permease [Terriglobus roseus DSM 18391]|uniref:Purine nucleoside permease n=1 Tax=Terriglobus roseus (strain DSM 18391 / NRRL B-41598 / KBS 63) TaxID=926566 RepID=I3ZCA4_TERRK|nr:purine nucleoside permease [Terriglobus roseus]AFL86872.1 purine nucleoside permease [Terriglobus roseus DSM 18391]
MRSFSLLLLAAALASPFVSSAAQTPAKIPVKVVVVAMFEVGNDTGDMPGEFQHWVEGEHLTKRFALPAAYHDALMNDDGVLGIVTGVGTARAAATVMALGTDPRFDLTHAYWLVAGIGGIDPQVGSLGSAVWSDWIVDGDIAHEIDPREAPKDWKTGYVPLRKSTPYEEPRTDENGIVFHLNTGLVDWAYGLTRNVKLPDTAEIRERRQDFAGENAKRPPFVLRGDNLSAGTFWHGKMLNQWARDWVKYQTNGAGTYAICGMEDTGTMQSLTWLERAGKVDAKRVLILRTASNYDQQRQGLSAAESLAETKITKYGAFLPSLDSAYRVGDVVVRSLLSNWAQDRDRMPGATPEMSPGSAKKPTQP